MKRLFTFLTVMMLLFSSFSVAFAAQAKVVDNAGLLTSAEISALEQTIARIVSDHSMDAVIVTVISLDGKTAQQYADDYYDCNGYGIGADYSGILLLLAMNEREWAVSTCGDAIRTITNTEIDSIMEDVLSNLSAGDYFEAFKGFLDHVDRQNHAEIGKTPPDIAKIAQKILIALLIGAAVALVALFVMRGKMNTARAQTGASSYLVRGSYDLYRIQDFYLYSHTSKVRKEENNSSGTHRGSSGRSHGGRSGRF